MTPEELRAYNAEYHAKHREQRLAQMRAWKAANREAHRKSSSDWQRDNPEMSAEIKAAYKKRHPDRAAESNKRKTPEALAAHAARQRVRNQGQSAPDAAVLAFYTESRGSATLACHWCGQPTGPGARHVDHKHPLSLGGKHVAENLVHACIPCNLKKGNRLPSEFISRGDDHRR